ncbi:hypothetical protein GCM10010433_25460 [Streptomyces pulveraceus]|uniref:Bacteriocin fulvocin C-related protein n=1 Tax=Streptomyces pulveraceus TaxID=68258 RepID=A0ABW1GH56_9ACTN
MKANLDRLPSNYSEFTSHPADYRRAIYGSLSSSARSDLWVAHFANYRKTHPGLSAKQSAVLDDAARLAPRIIAGRRQGATVEGLEAAVVAAFGENGARAVLRMLGPADTQSAVPRSGQSIQVLDCNSQCAGSGSCDTVCYDQPYCNWTDHGCGPLWLGPCSGFCIP